MRFANTYRTGARLRSVAVAVAAALAVGAAGAAAAEGVDRSARHDPMPRLTHALELSPEQQQDIAALLDSHRQWLREQVRDADGRPSPDARRQVREAHEALQAEIRLRLTDEQQQTLDGLQRPRRGGAGPRGRGRAPMAGLRSLDLSDEQTEAVRALVQAHRQTMRAARESAGGPDAGDRSARREQREAVRESMRTLREEVNAVLTAEQREQLQQRFEQRRGMREGGGPRWRGERRQRGRDSG